MRLNYVSIWMYMSSGSKNARGSGNNGNQGVVRSHYIDTINWPLHCIIAMGFQRFGINVDRAEHPARDHNTVAACGHQPNRKFMGTLLRGFYINPTHFSINLSKEYLLISWITP